MQRFFQLERVIRRAPLGMRFVDIIRDVTVSDSLLVQAWQKSTSGPKQTALVSPISGVHGFRSQCGHGIQSPCGSENRCGQPENRATSLAGWTAERSQCDIVHIGLRRWFYLFDLHFSLAR